MRHILRRRAPSSGLLPWDQGGLVPGSLVGRVLTNAGPTLVGVGADGQVVDLCTPLPQVPHYPTLTHLLREANPILAVQQRISAGVEHADMVLGDVEEIASNSIIGKEGTTASPPPQRFTSSPAFSSWYVSVKLHSPTAKPNHLPDMQVVKASGVTFVASLLERVIEEQAKGDPRKSGEMREVFLKQHGLQVVFTEKFQSLQVIPGTEEAAALKKRLVAAGLWSQYLEVGFGRDAEVFTKCPVLASVGFGALIGVRPDSVWNNPEPEVVLLVAPDGRVAGATLGNDVNLRDFEGRSALLLGKAKDNNAYDEMFTLDDVRQLTVELSITNDEDDYSLRATGCHLPNISRDIEELVQQVIGPDHQYPDGLFLFLGTEFAPTADRRPTERPGEGFTHEWGDVVTVSSAKLGTLQNRVTSTHLAPSWIQGITQFYENLIGRGML